MGTAGPACGSSAPTAGRHSAAHDLAGRRVREAGARHRPARRARLHGGGSRSEPIAGASRYDRLVLLARTSTPGRRARPRPPLAAPAPAQPAFAQTDGRGLGRRRIASTSSRSRTRTPSRRCRRRRSSTPTRAAPAAARREHQCRRPDGAELGLAPSDGAAGDPVRLRQPAALLRAACASSRCSSRGQQPTGAAAPPVAVPGFHARRRRRPRRRPACRPRRARPPVRASLRAPTDAAAAAVLQPLQPAAGAVARQPLGGHDDAGTPVEPDRAKYANPYVPTPTPYEATGVEAWALPARV